MQIINLKIEDNFFPHFRAILESFIKDKKVEIIQDDSLDFENNYPKSIVVNSVEDVRERVFESEKEIGLNEDQYNKLMDKFFTEELGIKR
ncbi:MAG: hypothetical protein PHS42_05460 [Sulfurimonas sp.]|nr:hypothetical protein [Sulfurimonas sp.]MDD3834902.1 hypothetical protein [Sulfurimonas sp.]